MAWFTSWWEALTLLQQIFALFAIPATIVLVLQTILLLFGFGESSDLDTPTDMSDVSDVGQTDFDDNVDITDASGLRLFTVRGLVAFFSIGGWLGIALIQSNVQEFLAVIIAFLGGLLAMLLMAYITKWMLSFQEEGNLEIKNAVAGIGQVYITIPPNRSGSGKIMLTVQNKLVELEAVTDYDQPLKTNSQVQVVSTFGSSLVVRPLQTTNTLE